MVPRQHRTDALVDGVAHPVEDAGIAQPERRRPRWLGDTDATDREAGGADALKIRGALRLFNKISRATKPRTTQIDMEISCVFFDLWPAFASCSPEQRDGRRERASVLSKRVHELRITEQNGDRSDQGIGWHYFGAP